MPLVENLEQVVENATRFVQVGDTRESNTYTQLGRFYQWYYFRDLSKFAPGNFIGYVDTTVENYNGEDRDDSNARNKLDSWFKKIDPEEHTGAFRRWLRALDQYVTGLEKQIHERTRNGDGIHILESEFAELCHEREPSVWMIRGLGGEWASDFLERGYVGFGYNLEAVDMSMCESLVEVKEKYSERNPEKNSLSVGQNASQIWNFLTEIIDGDYVLTKDTEGTIHCGIAGELEYVEDDLPCPNRRSVSWRDEVIEESVLPGLPQRAIIRLSDEQRNAIFHKIGRVDLVNDRAYINAGASTGTNADSDLTSLADELLLDLDFLEEIRILLEYKPQIIFQGPPGTGKTYVAQKLAECLAGSLYRVTIVQFHPSYAYEDFVQGFRPTLDQGQARFELSEGPLLKAAKRAEKEPDAKHFLIIDEINRGNLAKVFGELYFLLEYRDKQIRLQYEPKTFRLPANLYIIGTMNTADRSIALVDLALRRRFYFISFDPQEPPVGGLLGRWLAEKAPDMEWVAHAVAKANELLDSRHAAIGPSYFMKERLDEDAVERIWKHSVKPYIEEHLFGEPERLKDFELKKLRSQSSEEEDDGASADTAAEPDDDE